MTSSKNELVRTAARALVAAQEALRQYKDAAEAARAAGATEEELHDARDDLRPPEDRHYWRDVDDLDEGEQ